MHFKTFCGLVIFVSSYLLVNQTKQDAHRERGNRSILTSLRTRLIMDPSCWVLFNIERDRKTRRQVLRVFDDSLMENQGESRTSVRTSYLVCLGDSGPEWLDDLWYRAILADKPDKLSKRRVYMGRFHRSASLTEKRSAEKYTWCRHRLQTVPNRTPWAVQNRQRGCIHWSIWLWFDVNILTKLTRNFWPFCLGMEVVSITNRKCTVHY